MIRSLVLLAVFSWLLSSCGMSRYGLKNAWVFTEEKFRGTVQVDDNGTPITKGMVIEMSIYLDATAEELPRWTSVDIDGKTFGIKEAGQVPSPVMVGKNKTDEKEVIINAGEGNHMFRLVTEPIDPEAIGTIGSIRLHGEYQSEKISIRIRKQVVPLLPQMVP